MLLDPQLTFFVRLLGFRLPTSSGSQGDRCVREIINKCYLLLPCYIVFVATNAFAQTPSEKCVAEFSKSPHLNQSQIKEVCAPMKELAECASVTGKSITHMEKETDNNQGKRILVFGQIHGDEPEAGELALIWIERVLSIPAKNTWRIVPRLNPDGGALKTRTNQNNIDLNRNFPTKDWEELALKEWEAKTGKNPRRFSGNVGGSEPETKCAIKQIEDFKPDVIVSIHTPYGLLDYDGPKSKRVKFSGLPWQSLGTFPGSLGRYMWVERNVPVLTIELKTDSLKRNMAAFKQLQDQISYLTADA
jgi:hypothetical protein